MTLTSYTEAKQNSVWKGSHFVYHFVCVVVHSDLIELWVWERKSNATERKFSAALYITSLEVSYLSINTILSRADSDICK